MRVRLPIKTIVLMVVFILIIGIGTYLPFPQGPANIDWGVWIVAYLSYIYLVVATIFYARSGE